MSEVSRLNAFRTAWAMGVTLPMSLGRDGDPEQKWALFFAACRWPSRLALATEIDP